ncbi:MAG: ABC transporter ATP-binding protein [Marinilabiliales bacterium]
MAIPFLGIILDNKSAVDTSGQLKMSSESIMSYIGFYIQNIKDEYGPSYALLMVGIFIIIMTFLKNVFNYLAMYNLAPIRNGIPKDIRNKLFDKILKLPLSYYSNERKGDIITRMTSDVQEVEWSLVSSIEMIIKNPLQIIIYIASLFYMSYQLTLFVLILLPVSSYFIGKIGKTLKKTSMTGQKRISILVSILEETLGGLKIIKAFNAEKIVNQAFQKLNQNYANLMIKMFRRRYLANPLSEFLGTILMVTIMWYGGTLVIGHSSSLTSQELIAYLLLFYMIIPPAKSFSTAYYNIQKGLASAERIEAIFNAEEKIQEKENAIVVKEFKDSIIYDHVYFQYESEPILIDINLQIKKGQTVALVGQSGAGKSTIADLLPRFYDVNKGRILIDGIDIRDMNIISLRNLMGIVSQEAILFNDSFKNNIAFGTKDATEEEIIAAAKVANAHDFIMETPNGYMTTIGDRGVKLSGGQRQRISIARAVLKNPPIMILDEATSALDTESEKLVQDALKKLMKNRTSLVIAHRLSTIVDSDLIVVIHEGKIVETGKHEELLKLNGYYKKYYDMQMFS